ncbi:hypothetical protein BGZ51_006913 [Haplosporangium sp. Z 767]|nr:hypothetical protein BGZ51_006913 [Haplosporangium sp. Z 767]
MPQVSLPGDIVPERAGMHFCIQVLIRLRSFTPDLQEISTEFVFGFIQAIDGEKDPRNLLLAFSLIKGIIREFDIAPHVEDLFEVTFCYFPITFAPPPDDPDGITSAQLKAGLQESLAATPYFAKFALPLLLEKLASSSEFAKREAMETIVACCPSYGSSSLLPYAEELWAGLRNEIFQASSYELEQTALTTLRAVTTELSLGVSLGGAQDAVEQFLGPVISDCLAQLTKPDLRLAQQSCKAMKACAMSSDPSCATVTLGMVPTLLSQYTTGDPSVRKETIMDMLLGLLEANKSLYGTTGSSPFRHDMDFITPLLTFKDPLYELFTTALASQKDNRSFRLRGVKGVYGMAVLRRLLSDAEAPHAVEQLVQIMLQDTNSEVQETALECLSSLATFIPNVIQSTALPPVLETFSSYGDDMDEAKSEFNLHTISKLALEPSLFAIIVPQVLTRIDKCCHSHLPSTPYPLALLTALLGMLRCKADLGHHDIPQYLDQLVPHLLGMCIYPTIAFHDSAHVMKDPAVLEVVADITRLVMIHADVSAQTVFLRAIFNIFALGNLSILATFRANVEQVSFTPLHSESRISQQNTSILFAAVIYGCRPQTVVPVDNLQEFTESLATVALKTSNRIQRTALIRTVATILNKYNRTYTLQDFIAKNLVARIYSVFAETQEERDSLMESRVAALEMYIWIAKSMVLSVNTLGFEMSAELIKLFASPMLGRLAAEGYGTILGEQEGVLTKATFAVAKILPVLVRSLSVADPDTRLYSIHTIQSVTQNTPGVIAAHLSVLLPVIFSLTQVPADKDQPLDQEQDQAHHRAMNTKAVRVAALRCVGSIAQCVPSSLLKPFKSQVLRESENALDDHKREVRRAAVECRNVWFLVGEDSANGACVYLE